MSRYFFAALVLAGLSACVPMEEPAPAPFDLACNAQGVQSYVGKPWRVTLNEELRRASDSHTARVMWPGEPVTLEFSPGRLNVLLDKQNVIQQLYCG